MAILLLISLPHSFRASYVSYKFKIFQNMKIEICNTWPKISTMFCSTFIKFGSKKFWVKLSNSMVFNYSIQIFLFLIICCNNEQEELVYFLYSGKIFGLEWCNLHLFCVYYLLLWEIIRYKNFPSFPLL